MVQSYCFLQNAAFFPSQSHGTSAHSFPALRTRKSIYSQRSMKTCPLSPETRALSTKTSRLSRPRHSTAIFSSASLTRVHAHALSEFSIFTFTAQRFTHNPLKTRGLWVKPSSFILHDKSNITNCATTFCGEGSGEDKNEKKGEGKQGEAFTRISLFDNQLWINGEEVKAKIKKTADARVRARMCSQRHTLPSQKTFRDVGKRNLNEKEPFHFNSS